MQYKINKNGSYSILGEDIFIDGGYPGTDGKSVMPIRVETNENAISYDLEEGKIALTFECPDKDTVVIHTALTDFAPFHDIEPLFSGDVRGAVRTYHQGFGMEGPSGYEDIGEKTPVSYGLAALLSDDPEKEGKSKKNIFIYAGDYRHFTAAFHVCRKKTAFDEEQISLSCGFNLEGTKKGSFSLPDIILCEAKGDALKKCAEDIAERMHARTSMPPAFHWCSWYYLYQNMSQQYLEEYLAGMKEEDTGFRYIQLDAGYAPEPGDWLLPSERYPEGMQHAADTIKASGFEPGIWIAPFMAGDHSALAKNHPDWLLKGTDGKPVVKLTSYTEPKVWGYPDGNYYVVDTSNPEALAYIEEVFKTFRSWGYTLFKTDFILWNMADTSKVRRYDPSLTSVEILENTLRVIRKAIGEESYLLGCIAPFMPFIGYADGMRIAGDVGAQWSGVYGPVNMIREISADGYFQNVFWQNDPDSVLLRDFDTLLTPKEIESLALLQAVSGGVVTTSDPIHRLGPSGKKLLSFIRPDDKRHTAEYPFLQKNREEVTVIQRLGGEDLKKKNLLYVLNPTDKETVIFYDLGALFGKEKLSYRVYGGDRVFENPVFYRRLRAHESVLLFLCRDKDELVKEPSNLWKW